ncbi:DnaJ domain [Trypanosoma melophagium]|uniref:DnaJ domain n=1 Tax=Trypanosoma melophagium TaxID=715481 RepID=UPI00351A060F|nr:DnaJ domain [Trypanosoma melophagium]
MGSDIFELRGNTALYDVLGLPKTATDAEIRRAYYKLAVLYHPDKNPDGVELFKEISFAHSILSDPAQRQLYDSQRLRKHIEGQARAYDPMMDPNVELTAEELRKFVERKRMEEEAKQKDRSEFEKRREEEMRRRAEYDAQNPEFKKEYERMRALAKKDASERASTLLKHQQPTTAELMQSLERKQQEEKNIFQSPSTTGTSNSGGKVDMGRSTSNSVKWSMMQEFRVRHNGETPAPGTITVNTESNNLSTRLAFVAEMDKNSYSCNVERRIDKYANFDYRSFVEKGIDDSCGVLDDAILADALGHYDRRR